MSVRAIALHESVSIGKLAELFKPDIVQLFAGSTAAHCEKCGAQYAVFLPHLDDSQNFYYVKEIEKLIARDCENGKHSATELTLDVK